MGSSDDRDNDGSYRKIVSGHSGVAGFPPIRSLFETIKELSQSNCRSITTGITPIAMADASGWNICKNISLDSRFGGMCGFTRGQVYHGLHRVKEGIARFEHIQLSSADLDNIRGIMTRYYNGYLFPGCSEKLYNSQMVLWFLDRLLNNKEGMRDMLLTDPTSLMLTLLQT